MRHDHDVMPRVRLRLLAAAAALLNIPLSYTIKFMPMERKRTDLRGRAVSTHDTVGEALDAFHALRTTRKEKTDGFYYLEIESREGLIYHEAVPKPDPVANAGTGPLYAGLPEAAQGGPEAAPATQAADDEAEGAAGTGADGGHDTRAETTAEPDRPLGQVIGMDVSQMGLTASQIGLVNRPLGGLTPAAAEELAVHRNLDTLGER